MVEYFTVPIHLQNVISWYSWWYEDLRSEYPSFLIVVVTNFYFYFYLPFNCNGSDLKACTNNDKFELVASFLLCIWVNFPPCCILLQLHYSICSMFFHNFFIFFNFILIYFCCDNHSATLLSKKSWYEWNNVVLQRVTETQNTVKLTDRMWARLLASTNQPSFLNSDEVIPEKVDQ